MIDNEFDPFADEDQPSVDLTVECLKLMPIDKGCLKAFADFTVKVGRVELTLIDCGVFQKDDKNWVNLPSKQFTKRDGTTGYSNPVTFDQLTMTNFQREALRAVVNHG